MPPVTTNLPRSDAGSPSPRIGRRGSEAWGRVSVPPFLVLALVLAGGGWANAQSAPSATRAEPVPLGEERAAGPLRLAVLEVVTGPVATELVTAAAAGNSPPRDGITYVAIKVRATNAGERPVALDGNDFALTGASGQVRRFIGAVPPAPALDGTVAPGETREGWLVLAVPVKETSLLLIYDSLALQGRWADLVLALEAGATVADAAAPLAEADAVGADPAAPAGLGDRFTTEQWQIELLEIATCLEVFNLSDFRVRALTEEDAVDEAPWLALRLRVTNVRAGGDAAFLPPTAFMLADAEGNAVSNVITLTAPYPDAVGYYYPGAAREGWIALEIPDTYMATGLSLIRFLPFRLQDDGDVRYLTYEAEVPNC